MMLNDPERRERTRQGVCLALDTPDTYEALYLVRALHDLVGSFKVGTQLHTAACSEGVPIVEEIHSILEETNDRAIGINDRRERIFLDLKLHDVPATAYWTARAGIIPGVSMFSVHIIGGEDMCKEAMRGVKEKAEELGMYPPLVVGVTVPSSLDDRDVVRLGLGTSYNDALLRMARLGRDIGLDGLICPANKAGFLKANGIECLLVTPGIEWAGKHGSSQKQLCSPAEAVRECNYSMLITGSGIRGADDPREAANSILESMIPYV